MNRIIRFLLPLFAIIVMFFAMKEVQPAAAAKPTWTSSWHVNVNFAGNQPNATFKVMVWALGTDFYSEKTVDLHCYSSADVLFFDNQAIFNGTGGIRCAMPDMAAMVYEMTDVAEAPLPPFSLPDECDCKKGAYTDTQVDLGRNLTNENWRNPIFHLQDLTLDTPVDAGMGQYGSMNFAVDEQASSSSLFLGANVDLFSRFNAQAGDPPPGYDVIFEFDTNPLIATPDTINQSLAISSEQKVLYIGYSPVTGESLHGSLASLFIDPGCFGVD